MKIKAIVFDVSGTVLDFGSRAPVRAFVELFRRHGVALTEDEARRPMGAAKRDHIAALLANPSIAARWSSPPSLDALYREFGPIQAEVLPEHCDVLPGVPELVRELRERGIKFANTTGFSRVLMNCVIPLAEAGGYTPDCWVCPDDVGAGRPAPWMAFHAAHRMNVYPMNAIVKVGDTPVDMAEAHAAGMWAVGVSSHGNEVGLSRQDWDALPPGERRLRLDGARARLIAAGAHFVIERTADLPDVLLEIETRLNAGARA